MKEFIKKRDLISKITNSWTKDSWKSFKISQQPEYPVKEHLDNITTKIKELPPLVSHKEIENLKSRLSLVKYFYNLN